MSFDYDKIAAKDGEHSSWWTSYADLFMMLSLVFLLMYVASSLRSGSAGFQQQVENKKLAQKAAGLEQQIKVYNTLKDEALREKSTEAEQAVYGKLMDKLSLLQEEARDEKNALRRKAQENEEKEFALNQYQQLVKNIISANILAKKQIHHRDELIVTKDATIEEKKAKIVEMERTVAQNEQQIKVINAQLANRIEALRSEQQRSKSSKEVLEKRIAALRQETETQVRAIEQKKQTIAIELNQVRSALVNTEVKLEHTEAKLDEAAGTIQKQDLTIQQQEQERNRLAKQLTADKQRYAAELEGLKGEHEARMAAERRAFMANLKKQKLGAAARAKRIAQFAAAAERKAGELEGQLTGLRDKIQETDGKLKGAQAEFEAAQAKLAGTQKQLAGTQKELAGTKNALSGTQSELANAQAAKTRALAAVGSLQDDLEKTRAIANARKTLAAQIAAQFGKAGLKGAVDGKTGEVTLDFGGEYFETGSTSLKPKMRLTLDRFIPIYAKSLFNDPKLADKIANVEIVGYASSTYKGKYVNPKSVKNQDKQAIEYNLKLSFGRANSIFKHVLNNETLSKSEREKLLPLMKVVGRGYLPDGKDGSDIPEGMDEEDFCKKFDCRKAQKVVVKFNMKD